MSALASAVQARYPSQTLVELTRRKSTSSTTLDSAVLELAVTDVTAQIAIYAGVTLDTADARHLSVACEGVIARLKVWSRESPDASAADWKAWLESATALGKVTSRNRSAVVTTSELTPSREVEDDGEEVAPVFDPQSFDGISTGRPG
jgi:phage gp36-like protein